MSKGEYVPGDPKLLSITTEKVTYTRPDVVVIFIESHEPQIRRCNVKVFSPSGTRISSDSLAWGKTKTGGHVKVAISKRRAAGKYKIIANTPKEAWLSFSGLLFYGEVEVL